MTIEHRKNHPLREILLIFRHPATARETINFKYTGACCCTIYRAFKQYTVMKYKPLCCKTCPPQLQNFLTTSPTGTFNLKKAQSN